MSSVAVVESAAAERLALADGTVVRLRLAGLNSARDEGLQLTAFDAAGRVVGLVMYAHTYGPRAKVAIDIEEDHWHRGLPTALLARLCEAAQRFGVSMFLVRTHASDLRLRALLHVSFVAQWSRDGAVVNVELPTSVTIGSDAYP